MRLSPILRGALADAIGDGWRRWVTDWRGADEVLASVNDGWFERIETGVYGLTDAGRTALGEG